MVSARVPNHTFNSSYFHGREGDIGSNRLAATKEKRRQTTFTTSVARHRLRMRPPQWASQREEMSMTSRQSHGRSGLTSWDRFPLREDLASCGGPEASRGQICWLKCRAGLVKLGGLEVQVPSDKKRRAHRSPWSRRCGHHRHPCFGRPMPRNRWF